MPRIRAQQLVSVRLTSQIRYWRRINGKIGRNEKWTQTSLMLEEENKIQRKSVDGN
jgi:hypothetical protein